MRVYIASKLRSDVVNYIKNVHNIIAWGEKIRKLGFAVYVPGLDLLQGIVFGDYEFEDYFNNSEAFLRVCDAVFVCPDSEQSKGVQAEIKLAKELWIPVFYDIDKLIEYGTGSRTR